MAGPLSYLALDESGRVAWSAIAAKLTILSVRAPFSPKLYDAHDLQCVAGGSEGRVHQGRRTAVRRPDLRDIRGLRLSRDQKRHSPHFLFVVWLSAPSFAKLRAPSPAHLPASFKGELLAVAGDFAIARGAAGGTREVMR